MIDPATLAMLAKAGVDVGTMLYDAFKKKPKAGDSPLNAANKYLDKIPGVLDEGYNPFIQRGNQAGNVMQGPLNNMTQDPAGFLSGLMQNYQKSPGLDMKRDEMLQAAGNTAAAGGMRGSMSDIQNQGRLSEMLMGDDMQQWLQNVLGIQGSGLAGQQNMYNLGYNASTGKAGDLANLYGNQGNMAAMNEMFKTQMAQNNKNSMMGNLGSALGTLGGIDWSKMGFNNQQDNTSGSIMPSTLPSRWHL